MGAIIGPGGPVIGRTSFGGTGHPSTEPHFYPFTERALFGVVSGE